MQKTSSVGLGHRTWGTFVKKSCSSMVTRRQDGSREVLKYSLYCFICWNGISKSQRSTCKSHLDMICRSWPRCLFYLLSYIASNKLEVSIYPIPCQPCQQSCNLDCNWTWPVGRGAPSFVLCCASMRSRFGGVALRKVTRAGWLVWSMVDPFHLVSNKLRCAHTQRMHMVELAGPTHLNGFSFNVLFCCRFEIERRHQVFIRIDFNSLLHWIYLYFSTVFQHISIFVQHLFSHTFPWPSHWQKTPTTLTQVSAASEPLLCFGGSSDCSCDFWLHLKWETSCHGPFGG